MTKVLEVIWGKRKQEYFCKEDWTTQISLKNHEKSPGTRDGVFMTALAPIAPDAPG